MDTPHVANEAMLALGLSDRDLRVVQGAGIAASTTLRDLAGLERPAVIEGSDVQEAPAGWDPDFWVYTQQLGCS